jgi:hypothetical protein
MSDGLSVLLLFLGIVAVILIPFLIANKFDTKWRNGKLAGIASAIGGEYKNRTVTGNFLGHPSELFFLEGDNNSYPRLLITIERGSPVSMSIRKEKLADRVSKKVGLVVEPRTGDEAFDNEYFIESDAPGQAKAFLRYVENRMSIAAIFSNKGVNAISIGENSIRVTIDNCVPVSKKINGAIAKDILTNMNRMGDAAGAVEPAAPAPMVSRGPFTSPHSAKPADPAEFAYWKGIINGLAFGAAVAGIILLFLSGRWAALNPWLPLESLYVSMPLFAAFIILAFLKLRGTASSGKAFASILFPSLAGFVFICYVGTLYTNRVLDTGPTADHQVVVVSKKEHSTRGGAMYLMSVPSWVEKGEKQSIDVGKDFYDKVTKGDRVNIVTKPGHWGREWVVSCEKLP